MKQVYRYRIAITDYQTLELTTRLVLSVAQLPFIYERALDLWAIHDDALPKNKVGIYVIGTGHPMPDCDLAFIDTVVMNSGLVWHVFIGEVK